MDEQRTPPEGPPRQVTIRDRRRVNPEGSRPVEAVRTAPAPSAGGGAPEPESATPEPAVPDTGAQLAAAQAEAAGHLEDLQRLKAEFDNYRKRIVKEQTGLVERAAAGLAFRLLPVLDSFELAVASAEGTRDFERMLKGIEMVFGELKEVLGSEGLERIDARGKSFDPNLHEAALEVDGDGRGEPYVAEELRTGYTFKGRVLRPAMVKVAR
ncbi:MAG TPA: nucleotide exchange factor GrpE [Actinomycetota bacterium]|nr:nucleotide exchange factor GrpE [Actinomycetota bacterium]